MKLNAMVNVGCCLMQSLPSTAG